MSGDTFDQMQNVTFADYDFARETNKKIAESMQADPDLRATCPHCKARWEGTFEQLTAHVEACRAAGG